jgi:hypothetical protein
MLLYFPEKVYNSITTQQLMQKYRVCLPVIVTIRETNKDMTWLKGPIDFAIHLARLASWQLPSSPSLTLPSTHF